MFLSWSLDLKINKLTLNNIEKILSRDENKFLQFVLGYHLKLTKEYHKNWKKSILDIIAKISFTSNLSDKNQNLNENANQLLVNWSQSRVCNIGQIEVDLTLIYSLNPILRLNSGLNSPKFRTKNFNKNNKHL